MKIAANTVDEYIEAAPAERQAVLRRMRVLLRKHLPKGFEERLGYGMPAFVVPHELYASSYHCDLSLPLPFVSFANQKNFVALYHMGLYASPDDMAWFKSSWDVKAHGKLDMGKSCIRFKNMSKIPWPLLEKLATRMTPEHWVARYESVFKSTR